MGAVTVDEVKIVIDADPSAYGERLFAALEAGYRAAVSAQRDGSGRHSVERLRRAAGIRATFSRRPLRRQKG